MADIAHRITSGKKIASGLIRRSPVTWKLIVRLVVYVLLLNVAYVFLFPFIYMLITSIKSPRDLADYTINWIPRAIHTENYKIAFGVLNYFYYFKNSVIITVVAMVGHIASGSFVGYGFARYKFPGSGVLFAVVILGLIVPIQTLIIPMYMLYSKLELLNSYLPILLPTFFGYGLRGGLYIFIFRQFFIRLPYELEDAAKIDGCSFIGTFRKIVLPISQPAILVSCILGMVWHWHDYYEPSIFIRKAHLLPLTSMLPRIFEMLQGMEEDLEMLVEEEMMLMYNDAMAMAATVLVILPILIIFMIVQRFFIQGVERTGLVE